MKDVRWYHANVGMYFGFVRTTDGVILPEPQDFQDAVKVHDVESVDKITIVLYVPENQRTPEIHSYRAINRTRVYPSQK